MHLADHRTLGRSGLAVSPFGLGTMTFGAQRWGTDEAGSRAVLDAYVEAGGNFVDTADVYSGGRSEEILGGFVADRGLRDRLVIATKAGFSREAGNPHAGGNGAKNIRAALEGSLRRLRTDYADFFWVHVWDMVTPAEEVLQTLGDLVRAGKIRWFGLSNVPAWYVAKMATLAAVHGVPGPVAIQAAYSLVERGIEWELVPAAREFGLGITPWGPLSAGLLTGKYARERTPGSSRLDGPNPFGDTLFTERNFAVVDVLRSVASEIGRPAAQVALAWALGRPGVTSLLLGASRAAQLADNIAALDVRLTPEHQTILDEASAMPRVLPYAIFTPSVKRMVFGRTEVTGWPAAPSPQ